MMKNHSLLQRPVLRVPFIVLATLMLLASCEKAVFDDVEKPDTPEKPATDGQVTLTFNVSQVEAATFGQTNQQSRATEASKVCSRINLALYQDGERVKYVNQKAEDSGFGKISLTVPAGSYRLVVLAHSCDGNATMTALNKITFPNNKVTDTFYYMADITADKDATQELLLHRIVAMVRFVLKDAIPASVTRMKFYYTGGSSTLDGNTGLGCVNSKQTEYRDVQSHDAGARFEVYTMPHDKSGVLKMNVQALDAADNVVQEQVFDEVPVTTNAITEYTGDFFGSKAEEGGGSSGASSFTLMVDDEWSGTTNYSF